MSIAPLEHAFADADAQALALADAVGARLHEGIVARGDAWLAVPGGETPRKFLAALSRQTLDWPRVAVTLTDDRLVPAGDTRSNARLLSESLLDHVPARFVPLLDAKNGSMDLSAAAMELPEKFDAIVIGMGTDGHCASLFADGDNIAVALRADARAPVVRMRSSSVPEARVTFTLSALVATQALFVLIRGEEKRRTLEFALRRAAPFADAPIGAVLEHAPVAPQIYWSP